MQQSRTRSGARLFWWIGGAAAVILVVILFAAGIHLSARPVLYRRYVSPPLKDGTRYTFLYPAALTDISTFAGRRPGFGAGGKSKVVDVQAILIQGRVGPVTAVVKHSDTLTALVDRFYARDVEEVRVYVSDDLAEPPIHPSGILVPSEDPKYTRSEWRAAGSGTSQWAHDVTVTDRKAGVRYIFSHLYGRGGGGGAGDTFRRDDATIATSFRVLPRVLSPSATATGR